MSENMKNRCEFWGIFFKKIELGKKSHPKTNQVKSKNLIMVKHTPEIKFFWEKDVLKSGKEHLG